MREKYKLDPTYDPSMYPGVKCKFYFKNGLPVDLQYQTGRLEESDQNVTMNELDELVNNKYTKVSFMIFRTGNCLIVGNCTKEILTLVYNFVKSVLVEEYQKLCTTSEVPVVKVKKNKVRKKTFIVTQEYNDELTRNK